MSILISVKSAAPEIVHRTADQAIERPGARVNLILKFAIRKRNHLIQEVVLIAACDEIDVATLHLGCKWLSPYLLGPCDLVGVDLEATAPPKGVPTRKIWRLFNDLRRGSGAAAVSAAALAHHAKEMSWFFSGTERMRLPVAAKNALSTEGAATKMVGSPTPPQKSLDGITIASTLGISLMRIEL